MIFLSYSLRLSNNSGNLYYILMVNKSIEILFDLINIIKRFGINYKTKNNKNRELINYQSNLIKMSPKQYSFSAHK